MAAVFLKILNMSITASWLILAVIVLRLVLKKAPKAMICALWVIVAIRLLCPFSFESAASLIPSAETVSPDILYSQTPSISSGIPAINNAVNPVITGSLAPEIGASANPLQILVMIAAYIWLVGTAAMLGYAAFSYLRIRKNVREGTPLRDNIWLCDHIGTPFILGLLRPRIYLPSTMEDTQTGYVIAHESAHLKRRDHWWKPLGFLLLAVYWYHPLCWLAYILLCRDIELACDEKVIRSMNKEDMLAYSETLLTCSVPRRMVMACPLAFGEVGVKERIRTVLNYKKPAFWVVALAVAACAVVAVCFLTNPKSHDTLDWAASLSTENVKSIELVVMPQSEDKQYKMYSEEEFADVVALINQSRGKYLSEHEEVAGGSILFYLKTVDGAEHTVGNIGNTYLVIDGEYYDAGYAWLSTWDSYQNAGNAALPDGFFEKNALSLDALITLSQKGGNLTWSDFDGYSYTETGSGLYIRVYETDFGYSVQVGGGSTEELPMYAYLVNDDNAEDFIDIRTTDVQEYLLEQESIANALQQLTDSVVQTSTDVSFTVPKDYPSAENWIIYLAGRAIEEDGFSHSLHYFEDETQTHTWTAGKIYSIPLSKLTELTMSATLTDAGGKLHTIDISLYQAQVTEEEEPANALTVTDQGVTLTITNITSDNHCMYVDFEITLPEAVPEGTELFWAEHHTRVSNSDGEPQYGGGTWRTDITQIAGNIAKGRFDMEMLQPLLDAGNQFRLMLSQLYYEENGAQVMVYPDTFELSWALEPTYQTQTYMIGKPIEGTELTLDSVDLSPLSVWATISGSQSNAGVPSIKFKDGTSYDLDGRSLNIMSSPIIDEETSAVLGGVSGYAFDQPMDLSQIDTITLHDTVIRLQNIS